ncbi:MAG: CHAT domain-containing protein [bacterium]|nr:CHAT domain-containing protein [bacterium]
MTLDSEEVDDQYTTNAEKFAKDAQYKSSNFFLRKAILNYMKSGDKEKIIFCHMRMAENFQHMEKFGKARDSLINALDISMSQPGHKHLELAKSFQKIGYKYLKKNDFKMAVEMYQKALTLQLRVLGDRHEEVSKTYNSLALVYSNMGFHEKASEYSSKSFSIKLRRFRGLKFNVKKKFKLLDKGANETPLYSNARKFFKRSISNYRDTYGSNNPLFADIYENIGILHAFESDYNRALEYLRKSFTIRLELYGDYSPEVSDNYHNIGICLRLKGDYEEAFQHLNAALKIKRQDMEKYKTDIADIYYQLGQIHNQFNRLDDALLSYQNALIAISPEFNDVDIHKNPGLDRVYSKDRLLKILHSKAEVLKMRYLYTQTRVEDLRSSFNTYLLISDLVERIRMGFKSESYKLFFGEKSHGLYDNAIETAIELYKLTSEAYYKEMAFTLSEKCKAAVLAEAVAESRARRFSGLPYDLLEKEREMKNHLELYDILLEKLHLEKDEAPISAEDIDKLEEQYYLLKAQYRDLIAYFEKHYKKYYDLKYNPRSPSVEEIRKALPPRTAIIEYFAGEGRLDIFVLTDEGLEVHSQPMEEDFYGAVETYYLSIKKIEESVFLKLSRKLYRWLIEPILPLLDGKDKLIIIPHGELNYVPFEALSKSGGTEKNLSTVDYLIKDFTISYHYSAGLWKQTAERGKYAKEMEESFIGFAPVFDDKRETRVGKSLFTPLPGTEAEVRSVIDLFEKKGKTAEGNFRLSASEDWFKAPNMKRYSMIHFATHSLRNDDKPKLSGLLFSQVPVPNSPEDCLLYTGEIYNLDLQAELIVLSSCESGIGRLVKGEGMIALNRGFFYAGVRNTIFSLWNVEDKSTSRLMIELYRNILDGNTYAAALRKAKLNLIEDRFTAFPLYWSGFLLMGE